jgi:hypothetical protein
MSPTSIPRCHYLVAICAVVVLTADLGWPITGPLGLPRSLAVPPLIRCGRWAWRGGLPGAPASPKA